GSVNDACRLSIKPLVWEYTNDSKRSELFRVYSDLNFLKKTYSEFSTDNFSLSLTGAQKIYKLNDGDNYVIIAGNFALEEAVVNIEFPKTGVWYDYFKRSSASITSTKMDFNLKPGEYIIISTREFEHTEINTVINKELKKTELLRIYPNPASDYFNIKGLHSGKIEILNILGEVQIVFNHQSEEHSYDISTLKKGLYIVKFTGVNGKTQIGKLVKD
ncbi:MAG: T9SS type A sorting domain-containing protein, partial [Prolixibacteraceae bacterium]|nr:T9SS type A sorting domain-containing protein [Prolixibacteraceae bacterium]